MEEIAYVSLTDSASEWMVKVGNVWKPFTVELACWLEDMWKNDNKKAHLKDYVHVRKKNIYHFPNFILKIFLYKGGF